MKFIALFFLLLIPRFGYGQSLNSFTVHVEVNTTSQLGDVLLSCVNSAFRTKNSVRVLPKDQVDLLVTINFLEIPGGFTAAYKVDSLMKEEDFRLLLYVQALGSGFSKEEAQDLAASLTDGVFSDLIAGLFPQLVLSGTLVILTDPELDVLCERIVANIDVSTFEPLRF